MDYFSSDRSSNVIFIKKKSQKSINLTFFSCFLKDYIYLCRRVITRYAKRGGKLWIRIFPDKPVTFRAAETRMGSGKGNVEYWVAVVKPGKILYEIGGISFNIARSSLKTAGYKMPVRTRIVSN